MLRTVGDPEVRPARDYRKATSTLEEQTSTPRRTHFVLSVDETRNSALTARSRPVDE